MYGFNCHVPPTERPTLYDERGRQPIADTAAALSGTNGRYMTTVLLL
jgi:hypothetical protein